MRLSLEVLAFLAMCVCLPAESELLELWDEKSSHSVSDALISFPDDLVQLVGSFFPAPLRGKLVHRAHRDNPNRIQFLCCCGDRWLTAQGRLLTLWSATEAELARLGTCDTEHLCTSLSCLDNSMALAAFSDGTLRAILMTLDKPLEVMQLGQHTDSRSFYMFEVTVLSDKRVISGCSDWIKIWKRKGSSWLSGLECERTWSGPQNHITCFLEVGKGLVLCSSNNCAFHLWRIDDAQCVREFAGHGGGVSHLALQDKTRIVSAGWDLEVCIWDLQTGSLLQTFGKSSMRIRGLAVDAGGRIVIATRFGVHVYDDTGAVHFQFPWSQVTHLNVMCTLTTGHLVMGGDSNDVNHKGVLEKWR